MFGRRPKKTFARWFLKSTDAKRVSMEAVEKKTKYRCEGWILKTKHWRRLSVWIDRSPSVDWIGGESTAMEWMHVLYSKRQLETNSWQAWKLQMADRNTFLYVYVYVYLCLYVFVVLSLCVCQSLYICASCFSTLSLRSVFTSFFLLSFPLSLFVSISSVQSIRRSCTWRTRVASMCIRLIRKALWPE